MSRQPALLRRFARDDNGGIAIIFGLSLVVLACCAGLAFDASRYNSLTTKVQSALDAAALAGAKMLDQEGATDAEIQAAATLFFNAHLPGMGIDGADIAGFEAIPDRPNSAVQTRVNISMPSIFGALSGGSGTLSFTPAANVVYKTKKVELALVLDVTGSMNSANKLVDMKNAAKDVIDALLQQSESEKSVRIAIAPYSAAVNAGSLAAPASGTAPADDCVIERTGFEAASDEPPGAGQYVNVNSGYSRYLCPNAPVVPLLGRSRRTDLKDIIDSYTASGWTAGHIGTAWGWYLVSDKWNGLYPSESDAHGYDPANVSKNVVIMTDGVFNTSYASGEQPESVMIDESYAQFQALCTAMKDLEINVYTVGFDLSDSRAQSELETCASAPSNFYAAATGNQLREAFRAIAEKLNSLRIAG